MDRFFGWLTRYLEVATDDYKVEDIEDLIRALEEGFERSEIDRAADDKTPIAQGVIIHELKKLAPKIEKTIFLPGLGSVGGVSYIVFDNLYLEPCFCG